MVSNTQPSAIKKTDWINCAKFLAILAVIIDHTKRILYVNDDISFASYYSVSLFIIISGYLSFASNSRHNRSYIQTIFYSCKKITLAYILATAIYSIFAYHMLDFSLYMEALIHFSASGPFYYIMLYIQLMIANKAIYKLVTYSQQYTKKKEVLWDISLALLIFVISAFTNSFTNILDIYGGGGKLLGGSYLLLFYLGMVLKKHDILKDRSPRTLVFIFVISAAAFVCWWRIICMGYRPIIDSKFHLGKGINPPSVSLMLLAIFMLLICYSFFNLCATNKVTNHITKAVSWLGGHTLYIFLYHKLWLEYFLVPNVKITNIYVRPVIFFFVMIFASILLEYIITFIVRKFQHILNYTNDNHQH